MFLDEFQDATREPVRVREGCVVRRRTWSASCRPSVTSKQRIMAWAGALDGIMKKFCRRLRCRVAAALSELPVRHRASRRMQGTTHDGRGERIRRRQSRRGSRRRPKASSRVRSPSTARSRQSEAVADLIDRSWLAEGVPPSENSGSPVQAAVQAGNRGTLARELHDQRRRRHRNTEWRWTVGDLAAEPVAAPWSSTFCMCRCQRPPSRIADMSELVRVRPRTSATRGGGASSSSSQLKRLAALTPEQSVQRSDHS